jgi:hypothetical protein
MLSQSHTAGTANKTDHTYVQNIRSNSNVLHYFRNVTKLLLYYGIVTDVLRLLLYPATWFIMFGE